MATVRNSALIDSAQAAAAAVGEDVTWITLWDAAGSGSPPSGGNPISAHRLTNNPDALTLGQSIEIAAGGIVQTLTRLTATSTLREYEESVKRKLQGWIDGGIWVQYHDGGPGTAATSNVMNLARTAVAESAWTVA